MKKQEKELVRVNNMLNNDRVNLGDNFQNLLMIDLIKVLKEYFDMKENPSLVMQKESDFLKVSVNFNANTLKNFKTINT